MAGDVFQQAVQCGGYRYRGTGTWCRRAGGSGQYRQYQCLPVSAAGWLATGVSVIVSQYWGAERYDELRRLLGTFLTLLLAASVVMSLLGVLLAEPMLRLLQVPENLLDAGVTYLRITAGFCWAMPV